MKKITVLATQPESAHPLSTLSLRSLSTTGSSPLADNTANTLFLALRLRASTPPEDTTLIWDVGRWDVNTWG